VHSLIHAANLIASDEARRHRRRRRRPKPREAGFCL